MLDVTEQYLTKQGLAVRSLRRAILDGTLRPGQRLRQEEVAAASGLSRTPVREAFRQLEAEGLVVNHPHRGAVVAALSQEELDEVYLMRVALEGLAARLGAEAATPDTVEHMRFLLARMETLTRSEDRVEFLRLEKEFHAVHYQASGRQRLCDLVASLRDTSERYIRASYSMPGHTAQALGLFRQLLQACEERDGARAEGLVRQALGWTVATVRSYMQGDQAAANAAAGGAGEEP